MKSRKWAALLAAGLFSVGALTACTDSAADTAAQSAGTTAEEVRTETAIKTTGFRAAYAVQLARLRQTYGTPTGETYLEQFGVTFADLFDWDGNGTPELLVVEHEPTLDASALNLYVEIFGEKDGKAVSLLRERIGSAYGALGSDLLLNLTRGADGTLYVRVDNCLEYADWKESYYSLADDGTVQSTVLTAQSSVGGWEDVDGDTRPVDPDAYQIDGRSCSKAEFDAKRGALNTDGALEIECLLLYDLQELDDYLTGERDTLDGGALQETNSGDSAVDWLPELTASVGE